MQVYVDVAVGLARFALPERQPQPPGRGEVHCNPQRVRCIRHRASTGGEFEKRMVPWSLVQAASERPGFSELPRRRCLHLSRGAQKDNSVV